MPADLGSATNGQAGQAVPVRGVPALTLSRVSKVYRARGEGRRTVTAVDDVSFTIEPGAAIGLVGASGSGKSTLASMITGSERPTAGTITFGDVSIGRLRAGGLRRIHRQVQMVFQDPYGALNPLHTAEYTVMRPCQNFLAMSASQARDRARELLEIVGLTPASQFAVKLPHQLSGGQRQRVLIARALACDPGLIVADEPVSMLDVSLRAGVLTLLSELRRDRGLSLLYITHDLLSARVITDQILVLNHGRVVEEGPTRQVLQHPQHDYTMQLLDAVANPFAAAGADIPTTDRGRK
ncbi:MAG TPA: ATP-binding cassette domain-containing protein [Streptosporangiaceae bacterium]|nr:ATP-binding cassette domain-containing protein [Streptosporangiaceae bacterium]HVB45428.1 ATP-binding cassette domain-containing protein [Streptosporangiaceae bacterium]